MSLINKILTAILNFFKRLFISFFTFCVIVFLIAAAVYITWQGFYVNQRKQPAHKPISTIRLTSPAFSDGSTIPEKYSCDNENINPPLIIEDVPEGARSLVLILDDPDSSEAVWNHWLVWNISPGTKEIKEGMLPKGAVLGVNDFGKLEYEGPCPPAGAHRYFFRLYALDSTISLKQGLNRHSLDAQMKDHILEQTVLMGTFSR